MGSFAHESVQPSEPEDLVASARNARYGMVLFLVYLALFGGFVGLNAFAPASMAIDLAGINLAIWYGLLLIVAAMVMAGIYTFLCSGQSRQ